jgi:uncharacterized protein DUF2800
MRFVVLGSQRIPFEEAMARWPDVDAMELERLVSAGKRIWAELDPALEEATPEYRIEGVIWAGTPDVIALSGGVPVIIDWKSGRKESDFLPQLFAYAYEVLNKLYPTATHAQCVLGWLQTGYYDVVTVSREELSAFAERFQERAAAGGYAPGEHCGFCPCQLGCDAQVAATHDAATALARDCVVIGELTPDLLATLYERSKLLEKALENYTSMLRAAAARGPLPLPDGGSIVLEEYSRDSIATGVAQKALLELGWSEEMIAQASTMSKSKIEEVAIALGDQPTAAVAKRKVLGLLRDCGAIHSSTHTRLRRIKGAPRE